MTILKAAPEGGSALLSGLYDTKTLTGLSGNVSMQRLLYLTETLQGTRAALPDSFQPRTDVELCLLRLCDESLCGDLTALSARLDRVEELLKKEPYPGPTLAMDTSVTDFYQFTTSSFRLENYQYHAFEHKIPVAI